MVEPSPIVWVLGVVGGVLVVVGAMLIAVWWVRARDRRSGGMGAATKTVTHIVSKENNPDLLSEFRFVWCTGGHRCAMQKKHLAIIS